MEEYPFLSRSIHRMNQSGIQPMDRDHPDDRCGEQWWFEFPDRATAEQFRRDLLRFAQAWEGPRPWPYDGPEGRARLTGNLGVAEPEPT